MMRLRIASPSMPAAGGFRGVMRYERYFRRNL